MLNKVTTFLGQAFKYLKFKLGGGGGGGGTPPSLREAQYLCTLFYKCYTVWCPVKQAIEGGSYEFCR